ncbi:MAG: lipid hydroperoxide peroxidase [Lentisphaerae bacterium GWF2_44_16]|nr:MAG: lipid hydroperoxide peroxidase [Lentisphaerae bacterium GWF2_44_16]
MATVTLKNNPVEIIGNLPAVGTKAPDFVLTKTDLSDLTLKDFAGLTLILNIFPSIDTSVCAASVRRFNLEASKLENCRILGISLDLPFAHKRFCEAEGIKNVITVSELRDSYFGDKYGIRMTSGPLSGLLARSVVIIDSKGNIAYTQLVPEITQEPDYDKALAFLKTIA